MLGFVFWLKCLFSGFLDSYNMASSLIAPPKQLSVLLMLPGIFMNNRSQDPIFSLAKPLSAQEQKSHTREEIAPPSALEDTSQDTQAQGEATAVQGGWFGRGYTKARRKKKTV